MRKNGMWLWHLPATACIKYQLSSIHLIKQNTVSMTLAPAGSQTGQRQGLIFPKQHFSPLALACSLDRKHCLLPANFLGQGCCQQIWQGRLGLSEERHDVRGTGPVLRNFADHGLYNVLRALAFILAKQHPILSALPKEA